MIIKTFVEPPIDNNNYLIIDEKSKQALLIDCSAVDSQITKTLKEYNAELKYILLTHGHFDHIAGIRNNPEIKVFMNNADLNWVKNVNTYLPMFGMSEIAIPRIDEFIKDGDEVNLGDLKIKVLQTAGHTQGGVCYLINNVLFTGDTLFKGSIGRCDLEGGDYAQLIQNIQTKLFTLPDETIIYPGHGQSSTIGYEKKYNII